jgi:DNA-directed RNA polymerase specialized sigma24 family protein
MSPEKGLRGIVLVMALSDEEVYAKHAEELTRFATGLVGPADAADVASAAVLSCL